MNEIIQLLEQSIADKLLIKSEKRALKEAILRKKFSQREFDFLRSKVFDIAKANSEKIPVTHLLEWLELANKLTLIRDQTTEQNNRVYFSPGDQCRKAIITQIKNARNCIKICVFTISDNYITDAIMEAKKKNISVKIITDNDKTEDRGSDIDELHKKGVDIKTDNTENHMHHKFCIIDNMSLITGSYNWTKSAAMCNQENILITEDSKTIKYYIKEFDKLWETLINY